MIPCLKLCPRTKLQIMACYTIEVFILKLSTYGWDKIPAFKLKNKNLTPWWPQHAQKARWWDVAQNGCRQFLIYTTVTFLTLYVTCNVLSRNWPHLYSFHTPHMLCIHFYSVSVHIYVLSISFFKNETHKIKYILQITVLKINNTLYYI
jgi:hypothetical protein